MKKEESSLRSSSSRRVDTDSSVHHAVDSTGCMAGVFHLISSKYLTRRKFLTFGKKQTASFSFSSPQQPNPKSPARKGGRVKNRHHLINDTSSKNGCDEIPRDFPRSPTIPPEIRISDSLRSAPDNFLSSAPSVVARLMGLEHARPATPSAPRTPESAAEKRRKLLGALEKCNDNLQELRRIIEAVRSVDGTETTAVPPTVSVGKAGGVVAMKNCTDQVSGVMEQEQPSPVSVLEDFTESPPPTSSPTSGWYSAKRTESEYADICHLVRQTPQQQQRKKPGKDKTEIASFCFHGNSLYSYVPWSLFHPRSHRTTAVYPPPSSAMVEAVNEACRDVEMGQRREIDKVVVAIEDFVYRDLIQELIKEVMGRCHVYSTSLPFEKCKRKLRF